MIRARRSSCLVKKTISALICAGLSLGQISAAAAQGRPMSLNRLENNVASFGQSLSGESLSIEDINARAFSLFNVRVPSRMAVARVTLHPWRTMSAADFPKTAAPVSASDLLSAAQRFAARSPEVPPPALDRALEAASSLEDAGRVSIDDDGSLGARDMGVYRFTNAGTDAGEIVLNGMTSAVASLVGLGLAASTLVHEGYHRFQKIQGRLHGESIAAEIGAFKAQYDYIKAAYPTGEEIATKRMELENLMRTRPSPKTAEALGFIATVDALFGTGGSRDKIKQLVMDLGYSASQKNPSKSFFPSA
ncbi:MAG: hypothetical protein ACYCPQ_07105 [Elusimicrobiota bacterium]